jgi:hypothetical protein
MLWLQLLPYAEPLQGLFLALALAILSSSTPGVGHRHTRFYDTSFEAG